MELDRKLQFSDLEPVGPGTPAGRYLRLFWQPVMRAKDLVKGKAKPLEILGQRFTIYRGESGDAHIVAARCPHRGTLLSLGWVEGDDMRCRYHGWKFDTTGQCIEQPDEDKPFCERVTVASYPVREYLGLIFGFFGEGAPPVFPRYPDFDRPGVIVTDPTEIVPCSYWNRLDNDVAHIPWVHRATAIRKGRMDYIVPRRETVEETVYGWSNTRTPKDKNQVMRDLASRAHFFMPNAFQFEHRTRARGFEGRNLWDTKITWTVPVNDAKLAAFDVTHTPLVGDEARAYAASREAQEAEAVDRWDIAEKVLAGEMSLEEVPDDIGAYTSFAIEDYCTQVGQGSIRERGHEQLGRTDVKVALLRRIWLREVSALLEGRPLTQWQLPKEPISVMTGESQPA